MRRRTLALTFCALAGLSALNSVPAQTLDLKRLEAVADSTAHAHLAGDRTPGMTVAVAKNGEIVFSRGYGQADVEMGVAAGPETVYRIASITKQFTAAAIMRLADAGDIALDEPITKYLPDYPVQGHEVTVRHLLNHTSGIRSITSVVDREDPSRRQDLSNEELIGLFADEPFDFEPGKEYRYNNSGYLLLGVIIEKVTGTPYSDYMEHELFESLGLGETWYCDHSRVIANRAEGYDYDDGELVNAPYISMQFPGAAGALCSTARDLVRWTRLLHDGQVVSSKSLQQMTDSTALSTGEKISYGYGLDIGKLLGRRVVQHGGGINGFRSMLTHYPDDGLTIAVLTNASSGKSAEMTKLLARAAFGMELLDLPLTAEDMARYEGEYTVQAGSRTLELRVFGEGRHLMMHIAGVGESRLRYQGDHTFIPVADEDLRFVFSMEGGRAESVIVRDEDRVMQGQRKP